MEQLLKRLQDGGDEGKKAASTIRSKARQIVDVKESKPDRYVDGVSYGAGDLLYYMYSYLAHWPRGNFIEAIFTFIAYCTFTKTSLIAEKISYAGYPVGACRLPLAECSPCCAQQLE